jgi:hypothetical protein
MPLDEACSVIYNYDFHDKDESYIKMALYSLIKYVSSCFTIVEMFESKKDPKKESSKTTSGRMDS